jgi:hypothetical protein
MIFGLHLSQAASAREPWRGWFRVFPKIHQQHVVVAADHLSDFARRHGKFALQEWCAGVAFPVPTVLLEDAAPMQDPTIFVAVCLPIEGPQRIHDVIKAHCGAARPGTQIGRSLDGASVRSPRCENGSFLAEC